MYYIGSTQRTPKVRCGEHAGEVCKLVNDGKQSDTFATHFATHFRGESGIKLGDVRKHMSVDILWEGNPITCMKTYGTNHCVLCMQERLAIMKKWKEDKTKLINHRSELYGGCRHQTTFHRLERNGVQH